MQSSSLFVSKKLILIRRVHLFHTFSAKINFIFFIVDKFYFLYSHGLFLLRRLLLITTLKVQGLAYSNVQLGPIGLCKEHIIGHILSSTFLQFSIHILLEVLFSFLSKIPTTALQLLLSPLLRYKHLLFLRLIPKMLI